VTTPLRQLWSGNTYTTRNTVVLLCRFYRLGSQITSATGDQFTHDAATFPALRTQYGVASDPISLIPFIYVDDAPSATAPQLVLETVAGGDGYVDQDGNSTRGVKTFVFPSAATVVDSGYILKLNDGDSGVRDITAIRTTVASGGTSSVVVFGMEILAAVGAGADTPSLHDGLFGGVSVLDLAPAAPTAGTFTTFLAFLGLGNTAGALGGICGCSVAVLDT